jgi:hypothetical protein
MLATATAIRHVVVVQPIQQRRRVRVAALSANAAASFVSAIDCGVAVALRFMCSGFLRGFAYDARLTQLIALTVDA